MPTQDVKVRAICETIQREFHRELARRLPPGAKARARFSNEEVLRIMETCTRKTMSQAHCTPEEERAVRDLMKRRKTDPKAFEDPGVEPK